MRGWLAVAGIIVLIILGSAFVLRSGNWEDAQGGSAREPSPQAAVVTPSAELAPASADVREIAVESRRFSFSPAVIRVKQGERVKLAITNTDTTHGIFLPDFNARGKESLEFTADKKGRFTFYCANYCGSGHSGMQGTLIVE